MNQALAAVLGAVMGAIVGSYIATLVQRWGRGEGASTGRSRCDGCGRTLRAWELVPLVSALGSQGRCRTCGAKIDPVHWQVELVAALIGGLALALAPDLRGAALALFGWLLLPLILLDWRHFWLPDRLTGLLAVVGLLAGGYVSQAPLLSRLIGGAAGFLGLWLIALLYRRLRGREGLGGGDPKLLGAIGLWLGWTPLPFVLLLAATIGLLAALPGGLRATRRLPFGTMLGIAAWLVAAFWLVRSGAALTL